MASKNQIKNIFATGDEKLTPQVQNDLLAKIDGEREFKTF